jgi:HK97 family phage portal protein
MSNSHEVKTAYEKQRVGVTELLGFPDAQRQALFTWSRQADLAYACISKIVDAAQDPSLIVQRRDAATGNWTAEKGHPLRRLVMRPNPLMTEAEFFGAWLASEEVCGEFFCEIERDGRGKPKCLWPLDPTCMSRAKNGIDWVWKSGSDRAELKAKDVFHSLRCDFQRPWLPLAPLAVALGSVEADSMQTQYVRSFFKNGGVPSGILKIKGKIRDDAKETAEQKSEGIITRWAKRFGLYGKHAASVAVLDDDADYQRVGANLNELESNALRSQTESRICGVFGVPPLLVSALVGLLYVNQRSSAREALKDFWENKMSPTFKRMRAKLTWTLLLEWETEEAIRAELVQLNWDMSQVLALQESQSERSMRAREDYRAGAITLNEFREVIGKAPVDGGDYYLRPINRVPVNDDVVAQQLEATASVTEQAVSVSLTGAREAAAASGEKRRQKDAAVLYKYVAEGDPSTCKSCESFNGQVGTKDELQPVPNPECGDGFGDCRCRHERID